MALNEVPTEELEAVARALIDGPYREHLVELFARTLLDVSGTDKPIFDLPGLYPESFVRITARYITPTHAR